MITSKVKQKYLNTIFPCKKHFAESWHQRDKTVTSVYSIGLVFYLDKIIGRTKSADTLHKETRGQQRPEDYLIKIIFKYLAF